MDSMFSQNDSFKKNALNLESLNKEYDLVLKQYQEAFANYMSELNASAQTPCAGYKLDTTGVSQACYEKIWASEGCKTTGMFDANNDWAKAQTFQELIYDSFLWATMTDTTHRNGCYGNSGNPYFIIGVGIHGGLFSRPGLDANWSRVADDSDSNVRSLCTGNDGKMIICSNINNEISTKANWNDPLWYNSMQNRCCVMSVAMAQDGTLVGVGMDYGLWTKPSLNDQWSKTGSPNPEWLSSICIAPNGNIFCIGANKSIYKKESYNNLTSVDWTYLGDNNCCVIAITIAPDGTFIGVGTDNQLYTKDSYLDMTTPWKGPYANSGDVIGITTVANPDYDGTKFSTATSPNYNIDRPVLTGIQGKTFWGTSGITETSASTIEQCEDLCNSTPGCTGATFNPDKQYCWIRGGEAQTTPGLANDYAIIPRLRMLAQGLQALNDRLISINGDITTSMDQMTPTGEVMAEQEQKKQHLNSIYENLLLDKKRLNEMIHEFETLQQSNTDTSLQAQQSQSVYRIYIIIALIIVIFSVKILIMGNTSNQQRGGGKYSFVDMAFNFVILVLLLGLAMCFKSMSGYILWSMVALGYVIVKLKAIRKVK